MDKKTETPPITSKEFLKHSVDHFVLAIKGRFSDMPNKELWAISQIYRSWEIHKEHMASLKRKRPPLYNNNHIIEELSKHFDIKLKD